MDDGMIALDSADGQVLGFTSDKFDGWLWKMGDTIIISCIMSKQKGNFRALVEKILKLGYGIEIPTPSRRMREIVKKNGYQKVVRETEIGLCEIWVLKPKRFDKLGRGNKKC